LANIIYFYLFKKDQEVDLPMGPSG